MKNKGEILGEILSEFNDCYFFLHNTRDQNIAEKIMKDGFRYESQLPHSTDRVNPKEPIEITYFLFQRKEYGIYTVVIAIPREIYERYIKLSNMLDIPVEEVMSTEKPWLNDNDELVYTISAKHVLGYFNGKTSEFRRNSQWDPYFDSTEYKTFRRRPPADIIPK